MQLKEAHISRLSEVTYDQAVKYKEEGFTVLGRARNDSIAHRITEQLFTRRQYHAYFIYPPEHGNAGTAEVTFKAITSELAQRLFDTGHDIYWRSVNAIMIMRCYQPPNHFKQDPTFYITTELHNKLMNKRTSQQAFIDSKPAQEAWLAGKEIQYKAITRAEVDWITSLTLNPPFADPTFIWRPKPEPEKIPFNQQTIPADAWFRMKDSPACMWRIHTLAIDGCYIGAGPTRFTFKQLSSDFEYSADRINWFPCYTLKNT